MTTPKLFATAYHNNTELGTVVKITKQHIWIDRIQMPGWISKYKRSYREWTFEIDPLVEFISNGVKDVK